MPQTTTIGHMTDRKRMLRAAASQLIAKLNEPIDGEEDIFGDIETVDERNGYIERQKRSVRIGGVHETVSMLRARLVTIDGCERRGAWKACPDQTEGERSCKECRTT